MGQSDTPQGVGLSEGLGAGAEAKCWCRACERKTLTDTTGRASFFGSLPRFIVCPECGDKRCLRAWSHEAPCAKADLYAHNAWVERMVLRVMTGAERVDGDAERVIGLGAWSAPNVRANRPSGAARSDDD